VKENTRAYIMLILATLFWAGNFTVGKFAYTENIPPYSLAFLRWALVWVILIPFTFREILKKRMKLKTTYHYFLF
jgi:drug/metabolite transporter (DMT)-like permease